MNKNQYKRLLLILFIPLLALGWWVAENETLISYNHMTECEEFESHFSCSTISTTKKSRDEYRVASGGVFLWNGARLSLGFHAPVITTGTMVMEWRDGDLRKKGISGAGIKEVLSISKSVGANYGGSGPCNLSRHANPSDQWHLSCVAGPAENFKFIDEKTNTKYLNLLELAKNQREEFSGTSKNAYILSLVTPLAIFLLTSGALYVVMVIFSFVKHGRKKVAQQ